jgi:hypothetical protein
VAAAFLLAPQAVAAPASGLAAEPVSAAAPSPAALELELAAGPRLEPAWEPGPVAALQRELDVAPGSAAGPLMAWAAGLGPGSVWLLMESAAASEQGWAAGSPKALA